MDTTLAVLFGMPGWAEILVLLGVGVLIFGRRLPEVGKNIGRGIVEFKKGLRGIEDDMDQAVHDYYRTMGWDGETGVPTDNKLAELGIEWVSDLPRAAPA